MPGVSNCAVHGGGAQTKAIEKQDISNYRLAKWQTQLEQQTSSPGIMSLRDEIGISRIVMQETLDRCHTQFDIVASSQRILELVRTISSTVEKCHKMENSMGQLLNKEAIKRLASQFIAIIDAEELPEAVLHRISEKILETLG
jgi:hypothetical protein